MKKKNNEQKVKVLFHLWSKPIFISTVSEKWRRIKIFLTLNFILSKV